MTSKIKQFIKEHYPHINLVNFNMPFPKKTKVRTIKDILENKVDEKYFLPKSLNDWVFKNKDSLKKIKGASSQKNEIIKVHSTSITGKKSQGSSVYHYNGIMPTINAGTHGYSMGQIIDPGSNKIRKITPKECERLMGWKDDWTRFGLDEKNKIYELSNTARYKAIGNGIVSLIPQLILDSLIKDKNVKVFSTFSGVDGSCQLLKKSKYQIVGFSEFDPFHEKQTASDVLRYHYPEIKNFGDIKKIKEDQVPDHDLMFISAPCQSFSVAGKKAKLEDSRGTLFYETARILKEKKPKYAIFENVKGLILKDTLDVFIHMLEIYSDIGYEMDFEIYNSKDFGVAQNRERVFMFLKKK